MSTRILGGHCIDVLAREPERSYHLVVTSPPYWQLRAYNTVPQVWPDGWVGELGSEPDPESYLAHLVAVFRAVRRVLRDDGTVWVNLAGSYVSNPGGQNGAGGNVSAKAMTANGQAGRQDRTGTLPRGGWLKPLDYLDVPGLFARAMQEDGWLWRADIALVKKSPMPESLAGTRWERCRVKVAASTRASGGYNRDGYGDAAQGATNGGGIDGTATWQDCPGCPKCAEHDGYVLRRGSGRPTRAWERFLVFAKKGGYYWDSEGVREPQSEPWRGTGKAEQQSPKNTAAGQHNSLAQSSQAWGKREYNPAGRNIRNWQFWPTRGAQLQEQHFAAYPPDLAALAVKAGTSERCCAVCSAPWARVVERDNANVADEAGIARLEARGVPRTTANLYATRERGTSTTLGWRPTCAHRDAPWVPARVLDIFGGSGSTALAADRLGRDCVLVDLNPSYTSIAVKRVTNDAPLFADVTLEGVAGGD